jgi:hypothetical protein
MIDEYYYKMMNHEEIMLVQQLLFLKGYEWIKSGKNYLFTEENDSQWISIKPGIKKLFTTGRYNSGFRSMDLNELLDLIESDVI